ncbi:leukocyte receptor cluster member 1 homolog [Antedon mediterranea]|uniref:leukocyte receptor cluster member 1 homolog n=1 Tax=Antedon mediterranea TaxID=105859 RepID=UPI003AF6E6A4
MNILPKKSWHVLKKENIERVRRDEAKAAEEEKQRQARVALAEQEARTTRLREKANKRYDVTQKLSHRPGDEEHAVVAIDDQPKGHINFFKDIQEGKKIGGVNAEHEAEKEAEKINYEKKIGLLTYLGQSAAETQTVKPWYMKDDNTRKSSADETSKTSTIDVKRKKLLDPMEDMNRYLGKKTDGRQKRAVDRPKPCVARSTVDFVREVEQPSARSLKEREVHRKEKKHKTHSEGSDSRKKHKKNKFKHKKKHKRKNKHQSSSSSDTEHSGDDEEKKRKISNAAIERLRAERLQREAAEKAKTERLLSGKQEETHQPAMSVPETVETTRERYNSQFHPELARKKRYRNDFNI